MDYDYFEDDLIVDPFDASEEGESLVEQQELVGTYDQQQHTAAFGTGTDTFHKTATEKFVTGVEVYAGKAPFSVPMDIVRQHLTSLEHIGHLNPVLAIAAFEVGAAVRSGGIESPTVGKLLKKFRDSDMRLSAWDIIRYIGIVYPDIVYPGMR